MSASRHQTPITSRGVPKLGYVFFTFGVLAVFGGFGLFQPPALRSCPNSAFQALAALLGSFSRLAYCTVPNSAFQAKLCSGFLYVWRIAVFGGFEHFQSQHCIPNSAFQAQLCSGFWHVWRIAVFLTRPSKPNSVRVFGTFGVLQCS